MKNKIGSKELIPTLTETKEIVDALNNQEVDAIVGKKKVFMLRLKETEDQSKKQRDYLEHLAIERDKLLENLRTHQVELETQAEELRRVQQEAQESRDKYLDLYDYAPVGYFTLDEHNRIVEANLTGCHLLKTDRKYLLKKSFTEFISPEESERYYLSRKKALENNIQQTVELQMRKADGTLFYAQIESLKAGEERLRLAVIDITERQEMEAALARHKTELEAVNKELEAFSYSASHDLRAPLRTIDGFSQALLTDCSDKLDDKGKDYLLRIHQSVEKMRELIEGILSLSQIVRMEVILETVNLSAIVQEITQELKETQPERNAEFKIAPGIEVHGDARLLRIALQNLLGNAWKFTGKVEKAWIEFGTVQIDSKLTYFVRDNGAGFNMEYAGKLFAPFVRLHSFTDFAGTGVGLATVQRIIHRHGGRIWAEGEVGKGATFFFTLE